MARTSGYPGILQLGPLPDRTKSISRRTNAFEVYQHFVKDQRGPRDYFLRLGIDRVRWPKAFKWREEDRNYRKRQRLHLK